MDAKLQAYEFASFITDVRDTRQGPKMSQAYVVFMLLAPEPDDIWAYFHSSNTAKGSNFNNYRNPEVDRLLDLARSSQDQGARRNAYFKIQEILQDDVARGFLFYPNEIYAMKSGLRGVPVTGPYPYVEQWHWE
jgi:ABC-type transport system substrate-binding protein